MIASTLIAATVAAAQPATAPPIATPAPAGEKKMACCEKMAKGEGCACCKDMGKATHGEHEMKSGDNHAGHHQ